MDQRDHQVHAGRIGRGWKNRSSRRISLLIEVTVELRYDERLKAKGSPNYPRRASGRTYGYVPDPDEKTPLLTSIDDHDDHTATLSCV